jgi:hypothetical protein
MHASLEKVLQPYGDPHHQGDEHNAYCNHLVASQYQETLGAVASFWLSSDLLHARAKTQDTGYASTRVLVGTPAPLIRARSAVISDSAVVAHLVTAEAFSPGARMPIPWNRASIP